MNGQRGDETVAAVANGYIWEQCRWEGVLYILLLYFCTVTSTGTY